MIFIFLFVYIIPCIVYIIFTLFDKSNNRGHKIKTFDQGLVRSMYTCRSEQDIKRIEK